MVIILPLNQLLKSEPASIVAIPIQSRVIVPWMKLPIIILLLNILVIPIFGVSVSLGMFERPLTMDTTTIRSPAKVENILMKPEGVGLPSELKALSKSNALMIKAIPKMLSTIAIASLVKPKTVARPVAINRAPGTPKKNFE
jgi:hypothetical protein